MYAQLTVLFAGAALLVAGCGGTTLGRAATPSAAAPAADGNPGESGLPGSEGDSGAASTAGARSAGLKPGFDPTSPYVYERMAAPVDMFTPGEWLLYTGPSENAPEAQLIDETKRVDGGVEVTTRRELVTEWVRFPGAFGRQSNPGDKEISLTVTFALSPSRTWLLSGYPATKGKLFPITGTGATTPSAKSGSTQSTPSRFEIPDTEHCYLLLPVIEQRKVRVTVIRVSPSGNKNIPNPVVTSTSHIELLHTARDTFWQMHQTDAVYSSVSQQVFRRKR